MLAYEDPAHHRALAKSIGVTPRHREATDEETALAKEWMRLRGNAYRESMEHGRGATLNQKDAHDGPERI